MITSLYQTTRIDEPTEGPSERWPYSKKSKVDTCMSANCREDPEHLSDKTCIAYTKYNASICISDGFALLIAVASVSKNTRVPPYTLCSMELRSFITKYVNGGKGTVCSSSLLEFYATRSICIWALFIVEVDL